MVIRVRGIEIDNKTRSVRHGGAIWKGISPVRWRYMLCLLLGGGMTAEEIFATIYGHRADGGPLRGHEHSRVMVHHSFLKRRYAHLRLKVFATRDGGGYSRYELIPEQDVRGCR